MFRSRGMTLLRRASPHGARRLAFAALLAVCLLVAFAPALRARGGGGCFPGEVRVLRADGRPLPIADVRPGEALLAFTDSGRITVARVRSRSSREVAESLRLILPDRTLRLTPDHPVCTAPGFFRAAGDLRPGETVLLLDGGALVPVPVERVEVLRESLLVHNLSVDAPHTFFAEGFAVHNKGGGGGGGGGSRGGGFRSGRGGSSRGGDLHPVIPLTLLGVWIVSVVIAARQKRRQNLDHLYTRAQIQRKALRTGKLAAFIARTDPAFNEKTLLDAARAVFVKLQSCWQARDYAPMRPLLMPDLFAQHLAQIEGMIRNREINRLDDMAIESADLVHLRYTHAPAQRQFTVLFTASATDYYVDDRTGRRLRGDTSRARFQEFWTFQLQDGRWLLREIEQTAESDALKDENFFEAFTDADLRRLYAETSGPAAPAGPWIERDAELKANRTERMLNFLARTDKLWERQTLLDRARQVFVRVYMAREKGDPDAVPEADLFPESAQALRRQLADQRARGLAVEFRNFCVRKVELVLVRNYADNLRDDFTVRITAHAQRVVRRGETLVTRQPDVEAFEEYWTFGRLDNQWKLRAVEPPARGRACLTQENVDEEASKDQVQWYYRQTRAL